MVILLFGATGSAGGGVLRSCLDDAGVLEVRAVVRRPLPFRDARLSVIEHRDFSDFGGARAAFEGVDACFYCLGISTTQASGEAEYRRITHDIALAAARALAEASPRAVFHFISGEGAAPNSRYMWARVKAETERDLIATCGAVCYRPAYIDGEGSSSEPGLYKMLRPVLRYALRPSRRYYVHATDIGRAMLAAVRHGLRSEIVRNNRIRALADEYRAARSS